MEHPAPAPLLCLSGSAAPPEIEADLARVATLPPSARDSLWDVLLPSLEDPLPSAMERRLDDFCARHRVADEHLARALKACRFLLREAAKLDLDLPSFTKDLAQVARDPAIGALLAAGYERAKSLVRKQILRAVLLDHGQALTSVDWRLDHVTASSHGARMNAPIAILTLRAQEADRSTRTTFHASLAAIAELRAACDAILSARATPAAGRSPDAAGPALEIPPRRDP